MISFSRRKAVREAAGRAYRRVVEQARQPIFFTELAVPDTLDGRFELICLHAFLYLYRLKSDRPQSAAISQAFFDAMFTDIDRGLREIGTGDLSVGRHVKRMARFFYGRIRAYQEGLECNADTVLGAALARNLFGPGGESTGTIDNIVEYVRCAAAQLAHQSAIELCDGYVWFPPPVAAGSGNMLELAELP